MSLCLHPPTDSEKKIIDQLVDTQYIFHIPRWKRILAVAKGFLKNKPFRNSYFYQRSVHREIDAVITEHAPEHIYCHLIRMADYIRSQEVSKTIDFMDCFSAGAKKRMQASKGLQAWFFKKEYQFTEAYERTIFKEFDHHTIISEQDQSDMPVDFKEAIDVIKNGIDLDYFQAVKSATEYDIGFIGNLGYYPNVEASKYIADKIIPLLPVSTRAILAGARPTKAVQQLSSDQIVITGYVADIRTVYSSISILVAPLFNGIGLQNKILEAMAMQVPVITSSLVNNAIGAQPGVEILIADTPEAFAQAVDRLKTDQILYDAVRKNALEFVSQNFSWNQVTQPLLDLMES